MNRLQTRRVESLQDVQSFFDEIALEYQDTHGSPQELLEYRLSIIRGLMDTQRADLLVEIGCGTGIHLFGLADDFARIIGTDLSPRMIEAAKHRREIHPRKECIELFVDPAEHLSNIMDNEADMVLCVGAFEHMTQKPAVLHQIKRVLRPGGAFICLTPNGSYCWYRWLAPLLRLETRHLNTDQFSSKQDVLVAFMAAKLNLLDLGYWNFIPKADMPEWTASALMRLDTIGTILNLSWLRGGIFFKAIKPL